MKTDFKTITMICILGVLYLIPIVSAQQVQKYIVIDQFGYRPSDTKVAVIADPQVGFNSTDFFIPGNVYQVRRKSDNTIQYQGSPVQWNSGSTHFQSGDRGWWFEFTPVRDTGEFYVYDTVNKVRSYYFKIAPDIYKDILKAACKMYYYQRLNIAHPTQYAGTIWADGFSLAADTAAGDIQDQTNPAKIKDMSKGWMDAGDINKYVTYAVSPVHQLLTAYSLNSEVFTDDFNIPESGNGIPDILDEVKWELDWVMHMQDTTDGGTYIKVSHNNSASYISPLSLDTQPRFYFTPKSSAATIDAASMLAHAALVYQRFPEFTDYANECRTRAISAWNYFRSNPMNDGITSGKDGPSGGDKDTTAQIQDSVVTAIYLYALTNNTVYNNYIKQHYQQTRPMKDVWWGWGLYDNWQSQALMYYTTLPNADATVKTAIQNGKTYSGSYSWIGWNDNLDLYRGYMPDGQYHWGSNMVKADVGNSLMEFVAYNILPQHKNQYLNHALEVLHNFHGVNPMGLTYITSMEPYGGDSCAHYMYHQWYLTAIVPAGYIPGGPNSSYAPDPSYSGPPLEPPQNQPPQKSYKDWGNTWPENSWEVTEPSISYQAEYVLLLSFFAQEKNTPTSVIDWYLY